MLVGISIHELIYELCQGLRLPTPTDCPEGVELLLKQCFYEDPTKRPDFADLKKDLLAAHDLHVKEQIERTNKRNIQDGYATVHDYLSMLRIDKTKDDSMKNNYMAIIKRNKRKIVGEGCIQKNVEVGESNECASNIK